VKKLKEGKKEEMETAEARRRQAEVEESQRKMGELLVEEKRWMMERMEREKEQGRTEGS
jgi:hypothetical protein